MENESGFVKQVKLCGAEIPEVREKISDLLTAQDAAKIDLEGAFGEVMIKISSDGENARETVKAARARIEGPLRKQYLYNQEKCISGTDYSGPVKRTADDRIHGRILHRRNDQCASDRCTGMLRGIQAGICNLFRPCEEKNGRGKEIYT